METQGQQIGQAMGHGGAGPAPATVLVVDSDARALRLLEVGLRQAGYRVNAALSGDDAAAQADVEPPSVAIIDAELHDGDGFGLASRLRAMPGCERLLLLFVVDPRRPSDRLRAFEAGAGDVLERPVHLKEALWRVETLLEKAAQRGELGTAERGMRFFGTLSSISVLDLLQSMEHARRSGLMHCKSPRGQRGVLYFSEGKLIDAEVGRVRGEDALQRVLTWNDGEYRVDQLAVLRPDRVLLSSSALIMEAAKWVDEWNGLLASLPSLDSVMVPTPIGATGASGMGSPALSAEVEDVLAACNGQRSLREVVELDEELPLDTLGRLRALSQLLGRRLITPRSAGAPEPGRRMSLTPPPAPRLTPSPRLTPPPTPYLAGGPRLTPPIGPPVGQLPRLTPPPTPAMARLTPPPTPAMARLTPSPLQPSPGLSDGVPQYAPQIAQVAHSRPQPMHVAAEHTLPWGASPPSGPAAARAPAVPVVVAPSSISLPEFSADILPSSRSASDPSQAAAGLSQTSEDVLPVLSGSSIEPLTSSSAEVSGVPSVIVQLQLDAEGKLPPPPSRDAKSATAPRARARNAALLQPTQPSTWQRMRTLVVGAGLFAFGVGLYWVFQTVTEPPAPAPTPQVAVLPLTPPAALPAPPVAAPAPGVAAAPAAPPPAATPPAAEPSPAAPVAATSPAPSSEPTPELPAPASAAVAPTDPAPAAAAPAPTAPAPAEPPAFDPARFAALIQKGKQSLARGQFSKTRQTVREAAQLRPQAAEVLSLQADLALDQGDADGALRLARKATVADPTYPDAHLSLATAAQAKSDTGTARSHFKKYLELAPNGDRAKDVKAILQGRY